MAVISIATLKTFFETGDKPTEAQFVDLIDTLSALPTPGTTLTADQLDAIDNANSPNSGNPFATMADILAGVVYQGVWNATTNTPTLTSSVGTQGYYYVVSVAGTTNLNGITDWEIGDWAIFNGAVWQKVDNTDVTGGNTNITSINVATLQALQTGSTLSTTTFYNVTNAVGSTRVLQVYAIANNTNVVWAIDVTTGEIGTYDITGDVFVGGSGTYAPTITPDWLVCISATVLSDSEYLANSNKMTIGIIINGTFDFTAGYGATIEFDLPYGTLVSSKGTVSINIGTHTPTQPVYGYVRNNIIHVLCNDNTFAASFDVYATVIVDFTP